MDAGFAAAENRQNGSKVKGRMRGRPQNQGAGGSGTRFWGEKREHMRQNGVPVTTHPQGARAFLVFTHLCQEGTCNKAYMPLMPNVREASQAMLEKTCVMPESMHDRDCQLLAVLPAELEVRALASPSRT
eukprot:1139450-Pelagomonas_calceolata.AAC.5